MNNNILVFKIYDKENKEIKSKEINLSEIITNKFQIKMELNGIQQENVKSYSLEIKRSE